MAGFARSNTSEIKWDGAALNTPIIDQVHGFWFSNCLTNPQAAYARRDWWYNGGTAVDEEIRTRFGDHVARACDGDLSAWAATPRGTLALILLLDQFTRNIYRHSPAVYQGDALALSIVKDAISRGLDQKLHPSERIWLYHPFHHSEALAEQDYGLSLLDDVHKAAQPDWHALVKRSISGWTRHRNIVARFGRFPHRNEVLGRTSTPEEVAFMAEDGEAFGQGKKTDKS